MPTETAANPLTQLPIIPYIMIGLVFYFLVFKPQKQKQNEAKNMMANLKKNDQIVTSSGIHGTIVMVKDKTIMLRVDDNVKIEIDKEAVASVTKEKEA